MKRRMLLLAWLMTVLSPSLLSAHVDGMTLTVVPGSGPGEVGLSWTGGQPVFQIYRATTPANLIAPSNQIGESPVRSWVDNPGSGVVFFYMIGSPCQYNPPEVCDGIDNDCDGTIDGPGSEASCALPHAIAQCAGGACAVGSCSSGFGDCNSQPTDGCEAALDAIPNCGACGQTCDDGNACTVDSCVASACHRIDQRTCWAAPTSGEGGVACTASSMAPGCWGNSCTPGVVALPAGCANPDSDGDGLSDSWESAHGVDGNCDGDLTDTGVGGLDVALPDDPDWDEVNQKNAYVAYDWMEKDPLQPFEAQHDPVDDFIGKNYDGVTDAPVKGALRRVTEAFERQGIRLKIWKNTNPSRIDAANPAGYTSPLPHADVVTFAATTGGCASNGGANSAVSFYGLKSQNFDPRLKFVAKYAVFGHHVQCDGDCGSSACASESSTLGLCTAVQENATGMAEQLGEDLVISLGGQALDDGSSLPEPQRTEYKDQLTRAQAGTIMHELGHTFGLDHGGSNSDATCDPSAPGNIDRKPNYVSSMQYALEGTGIKTAVSGCSTIPLPPSPPYAQIDPGDWRVDYSSRVFGPLNEGSLTESSGIATCACEGPTAIRDISMASRDCAGPAVPVPVCGPVDWNGDGFIETFPVSADVNHDSLDASQPCPFLSVLTGHDDWSYVKAHLAFQCGVNFPEGAVLHLPGTKTLER